MTPASVFSAENIVRAARRRVILSLGGQSSHVREITLGVHKYAQHYTRWEIFWEWSFAPQSILFAVNEWRADGIIGRFFTHNEAAASLLAQIDYLPRVNVSDSSPAPGPAVKTDVDSIGELAARHFLEKGLKNFGYCCSSTSYSKAVCAAYCRALGKYGDHCEILRMNEDTPIHDRVVVAKWLRELPKPAGILAIHDHFGVALSLEAREIGIHVPHELAILGSGNDEISCALSVPPLSSIMLPAREIGYQAAKMLDGLMSKKTRKPPPTLFLPALGVAQRQSTDVVAIDDPHVAAAVRFVHDRVDEQVTVDDVLRAIPLCRKTLERRFVKAIGVTPSKHIIEVQIREAQRLLAEGGMKITMVAAKSGFDHQPRFRRLFRKETGLTPVEYRRKFRPSS
jgi:LacI family transcriptional regulator